MILDLVDLEDAEARRDADGDFLAREINALTERMLVVGVEQSRDLLNLLQKFLELMEKGEGK